jgi:molecular chaperone DnaK
MVSDAEEHAEEDRKKREETQVKNEADALIYSVQKSLREHGEHISAEDRANIEEKCDQLRSAIESGNIEDIKKASEELNAASHKLSEAIYAEATKQKAEGQGPEQTAGAQAEKKEDVVDAEFEVEDEENK